MVRIKRRRGRRFHPDAGDQLEDDEERDHVEGLAPPLEHGQAEQDRGQRAEPHTRCTGRSAGSRAARPTHAAEEASASVVDSDFSRIPAYNRRESPIEGDFYLPPQFTLVYASADGGANQFGNRLIRLCDREAKRLLNHLEAVPEDPERHELQNVIDRPHSHFRQWVPK